MCYRPPAMNSTLTMWHFLIKASILRKFCVIYDAENKGPSHFSSDENKGLKSIAEIHRLVIKPLITHSSYGVNKTGHIMLNLFRT